MKGRRNSLTAGQVRNLLSLPAVKGRRARRAEYQACLASEARGGGFISVERLRALVEAAVRVESRHEDEVRAAVECDWRHNDDDGEEVA